MPEIKFNGETRNLPDGANIEDAVRHGGFDFDSVIVVLNGDVVSASSASTVLKDGDSLDLLKIAGGG